MGGEDPSPTVLNLFFGQITIPLFFHLTLPKYAFGFSSFLPTPLSVKTCDCIFLPLLVVPQKTSSLPPILVLLDKLLAKLRLTGRAEK